MSSPPGEDPAAIGVNLGFVICRLWSVVWGLGVLGFVFGDANLGLDVRV